MPTGIVEWTVLRSMAHPNGGTKAAQPPKLARVPSRSSAHSSGSGVTGVRGGGGGGTLCALTQSNCATKPSRSTEPSLVYCTTATEDVATQSRGTELPCSVSAALPLAVAESKR